MANLGKCLNLKERGSVSRSAVENHDVTGPFLRFPIANPLRVADPRSVPLDQIKGLPDFVPRGKIYENPDNNPKVTLMGDNLIKAKKIFLKFRGRHFQMDREGIFEEYRAFRISRSTEELWAREWETTLLEHFRNFGLLDTEAHTFFVLIENYVNNAALLEFVSIVEQKSETMDTFTKLLLCERITKAVSLLEKDKNSDPYVLRRAIAAVSVLLKLAQKESITVHPYYRDEPLLREILEEANLRQRINCFAEEFKAADKRLKGDTGK